MSNPAKARGLADLDALVPPAPAAKPGPAAAAPNPSRPPARPARLPAGRPAAALPPARPPAATRQRVRIRSQVFYLPDDQIEGLDRLSRQTERSKSDLVREAIANYLKGR